MPEILLLGPDAKRLEAFLRGCGERTACLEEALDSPQTRLQADHFLISFGYRHILRPNLLRMLKRPPINLHISLLPWNRGADPNLWSFLEDTPKGVTIHEVDVGIDTGPVLVQREVAFGKERTLRETYDRLQTELEALFKEQWTAIREGTIMPMPQRAGGGSHRLRDKAPYESLLVAGWDTPVASLIGRARKR